MKMVIQLFMTTIRLTFAKDATEIYHQTQVLNSLETIRVEVNY